MTHIMHSLANTQDEVDLVSTLTITDGVGDGGWKLAWDLPRRMAVAPVQDGS